MLRIALGILLAAAPAGNAPALEAPQEQEPRVDVERLADGVYLFTHQFHRSLFVVGSESVMVTDPQSSEAAARYVEEVRKVTDLPIRWVVYSHHHEDHASGAEVFGDDVTIVAQSHARLHIDEGSPVVRPDLFFHDAATVMLGDLRVNLIYPGPSETDSSIIVWVPDREVAFMVDAVAVRTVPWRDLGGADPIAWIDALKGLEDLDFEILATGHGPTGTKEHVAEYIVYFETLVGEVRDRMRAGENLEQIQASLELPQYSDWARYDSHFDLNIEGIYRALERRR